MRIARPVPSALEVDDTAADILRKVDRHLIPWLFALGICCYLDRTNLSFAAVQLSNELGLSCSSYGLGAGLFFLGYSFQIPSNMALQRFGAPLWLSLTVIVWGIVAMAFAWTTGTAMFLALRVALGLAECGTFPGIWTHLSKFYTSRELGRAYAAVTTSTAIAQIIGAPVAAAILSFDGLLGVAGWQWLFILEGSTTIVFGVLLRRNLAVSPAKAAFLEPSEQAWLQRRQDMEPTSTSDTSIKTQMKSLVAVCANWRVFYMAALWVSITQAMYSIIFFAPLIISSFFAASPSDLHSPPPSPFAENSTTPVIPAPAHSSGCGGDGHGHSAGAGVALLTMVPFAAAAAAMMVNAKWAEAANERHRHAGIPILMGAGAMALTPVMLRHVSPIAAFFSLVTAAACVWAFHAPFMSWPAAFLKGHEAQLGFALINSLGSFGGFIGPFVLGFLADKGGSYDLAMIVLAGVLAVGGVGILLFPDGTRKGMPAAVVLEGSGKLGERGGEGNGGEEEEEEEEEGEIETRPIMPRGHGIMHERTSSREGSVV